jgi:hypothetical protein
LVVGTRGNRFTMSEEQPRDGEPWAKTSSGDADGGTDDDQEEVRPPDEAALAERARTSRDEVDALRREARGEDEDDEKQDENDG